MSNTFQSTIVIVSNLAFLFPAYECLFTKRFLESFIWFSVFVTSMLYHICKFGPFNFPDPAGICFVLSYSQYEQLDLFFAINTIPPLYLSFTLFDVVIYDLKSAIRGVDDPKRPRDEEEEEYEEEEEEKEKKRWRSCCCCTKKGECSFRIGFLPWSSLLVGSDSKRMRERDTQMTFDKADFASENWFGGLDRFRIETSLSSPPRASEGTVGISINPRPSEYESPWMLQQRRRSLRRSGDGSPSETEDDLSLRKEDFVTKKSNMVGLETLYIATFGYIVGSALLINNDPDALWYTLLNLSCLAVVILWNMHFFYRHDELLVGFRLIYLVLGLVVGALAVAMMGAQTDLPASAYWATHSVWHVAAGFARWFLLKAKYRFYYHLT